MKRYMTVSFLFFVIFIISAGVSAKAEPSFSAGGSVWYSWWKSKPGPDNVDTQKPGLLYGPVFSADIAEGWSLAGVLLTGNVGEKYDGGSTMNYRRYDIDMTLNYSINRYFKVFGGAKYLQFGWNDDQGDSQVFQGSDNIYRAYGPALGIGVLIPLSDSLFLVNNLSYVYMPGKMKGDYIGDMKIAAYGYNFTCSLAYYVPAIRSTVMLGGRYQSIKTDYKSGDIPDETTTFYGATLSVVYHFNTGD